MRCSRAALSSALTGFVPRSTPSKILIIGCLGQIGQELMPALQQIYGANRVIGADVRAPFGGLERERIRYIDLSTPAMLNQLMVEERVDWIIHNASILSAVGERNPDLAMQVNFEYLNTVLQVARQHSTPGRRVRLLVPSSISAFGPTTPPLSTPNETVQKPTTIYGISKVYAELMGSYWWQRFGVDFRSLRYPGIISAGEPGGGTTDWAVDIFKQAVLKGKYEGCFLSAQTSLPMMYMPDCLKATIQLLDCPDDKQWSTRVFNVTAMSLAPQDLEREIRKHLPKFEIVYAEPGDFRQRIADSWPRSIDDTVARKEWGWEPKYDVAAMTKEMLAEMRLRYTVRQ